MARRRLAQGDTVTPEELEEDRRLEEAGCTVTRGSGVPIVLDLRAGRGDGQQRR